MLFVPVEAIADIETDRIYLRVATADVFHQDCALMPEVDGQTSDTRSGTATTSTDVENVQGVAVVAVITLATLFLVMSGSFQPIDAAIAFIVFLGVAAVAVWACLLWCDIARP